MRKEENKISIQNCSKYILIAGSREIPEKRDLLQGMWDSGVWATTSQPSKGNNAQSVKFGHNWCKHSHTLSGTFSLQRSSWQNNTNHILFSSLFGRVEPSDIEDSRRLSVGVLWCYTRHQVMSLLITSGRDRFLSPPITKVSTGGHYDPCCPPNFTRKPHYFLSFVKFQFSIKNQL